MNIVIVGAGVVGVTAAWHLRAEGHDVTVLDRADGPAAETSFANGGHVSATNAAAWAAPGVARKVLGSLGRADAPLRLALPPDWRLLPWAARFLRECRADRSAANTEAVQRLAAHSRAALAELDATLDLPRDRNRAGIMNLLRSDAELDALARRIPLWRSVGIDARVLDAASVLEAEPALRTSQHRYAGGILVEHAESGDARAFTTALAAHAAASGVTFRFGARVRRVRIEGGRARGVETDAGPVAADAVVIAAGAFSPGLLAGTRVRLPVYPGKGYSVTVPVGGSNAAPRVALTDEHEKVVYARLGDRLRAAGTLELAGLDARVAPARAGAILDAMRRTFPQGGDFARAQAWAGLRPMTPDGRPVVGESALPGLWLCTGHGPLGWTLAAGSGRLLAELIAGRAPSIDPALVSPARF